MNALTDSTQIIPASILGIVRSETVIITCPSSYFQDPRAARLARSAWLRQRDDSDHDVIGRHAKFRPGGGLLQKHDCGEARSFKIRHALFE